MSFLKQLWLIATVINKKTNLRDKVRVGKNSVTSSSVKIKVEFEEKC